jgi:hypothetical protein
MTKPNLGRRGRIAAAGLLIALSGSLIPMANVLAVDVFPATGGSAISADDAGTDNWTLLIGPQIREVAAGELFSGSTTILNAPSAFRFKPGDGGVMLSPGCNIGQSLSITSTQATLTVGSGSTNVPCGLTFILKVQPATGKGLASNHITKTGTSSAPGGGTSYGLLTIVAGAAAQMTYDVQPSATNTGGAAFGTQPKVRVRDQFGNNVSHAPVALAITPGTGPAGATLTCATSAPETNSVGIATFSGCKIDMAGTYRLRASSGAASVDSDTVTVTGGSANKIVFKGYPATTTPPALTPQPRIAVVDAGGNTVTSVPATDITLTINKNAATFSCSSGLTVATVSGVATFAGCTQTTPGTGYTLTASASFANTTGGTFAVSSPTGEPGSISLTTFCGRPTPIATSGPNQCAADSGKSPAQANIKLPQTSSEGVRLKAHVASNGANRSLTFEVSKDQATWSPIGTATTNGSGDASVFYRPSDNRYYRVRIAGAADPAATSPLVRVVVRALVFLRPAGCTSSNPCRVHLNDQITFTATARPNRAELPAQTAQFVVQRKSGSTWVDADVDALTIPVSKASGTAVFSLVFNAGGTWRIRANLLPTSVNANSFPTDYEYYSVS